MRRLPPWGARDDAASAAAAPRGRGGSVLGPMSSLGASVLDCPRRPLLALLYAPRPALRPLLLLLLLLSPGTTRTARVLLPLSSQNLGPDKYVVVSGRAATM
eukprot:scaffold1970_cov396-Prasinococcus_capsulatus_cf.AAC.24